MAENTPQDPLTGSQEPHDVPPAPSPGGTVADEYVRRAARGRSAGSKRGRVRPDASGAPTAEPADEDVSRPLSPAERTLRESILELYTGAQMIAYMADPTTAELIKTQKEACADAWVILARRDARVKALLKRLTTGSAWGALVMAHLPIVLPLLMRKGILPGGALFGGAPFNAFPGGGSDGGSVSDDWPYDVNLFNGTVGFDANGHGGAS
jgi:hypothetical protein